MQKTATVAVINSDKKILILRRGRTAPWMPGRYCLPGGKCEVNEPLNICASRELYEETGISYFADKFKTVNVNYSEKYSKTVWVAFVDDNNVKLNWEHDDYLWVDARECLNSNIVPGLKTTIKTLLTNEYIS